MANRTEAFFITRDNEPEKEVTKGEFVRAEREAGFHNTMGQPLEPATAGFSIAQHGSTVSGRVAFI